MKESILVGARGWDHETWSGGFYPAELPRDWRFCFYSNNLRAVLVPSGTWAGVDTREVAGWVEDSDPAFRFVPELPPSLSSPMPLAAIRRELALFLALVEPIEPQIAGYVVRIAPGAPADSAWLENLLSAIGAAWPVCADLPCGWRTAACLDLLSRYEAGLLWDANTEPAPRRGGRLMIALSRRAEPLALRHALEGLSRWQGEGAAAGLFLDAADRAGELAQQARLIAEMMGV